MNWRCIVGLHKWLYSRDERKEIKPIIECGMLMVAERNNIWKCNNCPKEKFVLSAWENKEGQTFGV